jgi:acylglycerol lipase
MWQRFEFHSWDGTVLSAGLWTATAERPARTLVWPAGNPAPIVLIHGLGEHLGRYATWAAEWAAAGRAAVGFDFRGHGKSPGKRGDARQLEDHVQDILAFWHNIEQASSRPAAAPLPVIAHSMGGLLALRAARQRQTSSVRLCLLAPYFRPAFRPQAWRLWAARCLRRWYPSLTLDVGLRWEQFARDQAVRDAIRCDPLSHQRLSVRLALELLASGEKECRSPESCGQDCWILHGDADMINCHHAAQSYAENHSGVRFFSLPGGYHQIHNDAGTRPRVRELIHQFLDASHG